MDKRVVIWEGPYNLGSENCRPCSRWGRQITSGYMGTRAQLGGISQRSPRAVSGAGTWPPERGARRQVPEAVRASAGTKCHHLGGGGLQPIEVYFLTVLEARRPKARCGQGHSPSQALGTALPCLFLPSFCWWVPWLAATSHQSASVVTHLPPCGSPCLHLVLPRHMSLSSFYKDTPYMGLRAHPPPG